MWQRWVWLAFLIGHVNRPPQFGARHKCGRAWVWLAFPIGPVNRAPKLVPGTNLAGAGLASIPNRPCKRAPKLVPGTNLAGAVFG